MKRKRLLVACEYTATIRDAFAAIGWDAWSCDLLPSEKPGQHIQDDVIKHLDKDWDMLIQCAPCTYILNSGVKWLYKNGKRFLPDGTENPRNPVREAAMYSGAYFFKALMNAPVERICGENPIMLREAMSIIGMEWTQKIQPWQFGHGETKATCLWLKNLPKLNPANIVEGREQRIHNMSPGKNRGHERSRFFSGVAKAMADQWGDLP